jgi:hypothetical protein
MGKRNSPNTSTYNTTVTVHLANGKARTHFVVVQCHRTLNVKTAPCTFNHYTLVVVVPGCNVMSVNMPGQFVSGFVIKHDFGSEK